MNNQNPSRIPNFYILVAIFIISLLVSLLWFYFSRGFEPILVALASIFGLAQAVTLRRGKWLQSIIIVAVAIVVGSGLLLIRNLDGESDGEAIKLTIRATTEEGEPIARGRVLLIVEGAPYSQLTDSNGVAVFTSASSSLEAHLIIQSEEYQANEQVISLSRSQTINVELERKDKNVQGVIVRVIDDNNNLPIEGARIILIAGGDVLEDSTDTNGISRFKIEFAQDTVDAEIQVITDEYEIGNRSISLQPERVQDIRLNPLTEEIIDVSETIGTETSTIIIATPQADGSSDSATSNPTSTWKAPDIVASAASSSEISGEITQNTRLTKQQSPFIVANSLIVRPGVALIIDPGVIVKFAARQALYVDGLLIARGTEGDPIIFTSAKDDTGGDTNGDGSSSAAIPGDWRAIIFRDPSGDENARIENSIIRFSGSHNEGAIHLVNASPDIVNNTITNNQGYAISADAVSYPTVNNNSLSENFGNGIEIRSGTLSTSGAWGNTDIVYSVTGPLTIGENATLSIQPNTIVKFGENVFFDVYGSLRVQGTSGNPIVLTSIKDDAHGGDTNGDGSSSAPSAGDWTMFRFRDSSNDANSVIEHSSIQFAGEHKGNRFGAIHLEAASPTIRDNTITDNYWFAISADLNSFPTVSRNQLQNNNGNGLEIRSGDMADSGTWKNLDIVYVVTGPITVRNTATLILDPGIIVKFTEKAHINVHGSFQSNGTNNQKVILTSFKDDAYGGDTNGDGSSSAPAPGDWTMIRFYDDSNDVNCTIDHTIIKYGGRHSGNKYGAIHILSASPTIRNSNISDNYYYGIWYDGNSSPTLQDNTFSGNIEGDFYQEQ